MAKKETIYDIIFEVYKLQYSSISCKKMIRSAARRWYKKEFGKEYNSKDWSVLSQLEKDRFVYTTIRDKMMNNDYIDISKKHSINREIDEYLNKTLLSYSKAIKEHNNKHSQIFDTFYDEKDDDFTKEIKYKKFIDVLLSVNNKMTIPTFEEWIVQNKQMPLRPYDYLMSAQQEIYEEDIANEVIVTETEKNSIILKTLLKVLKEKSEVEIDSELISKALSVTKNFELNNDGFDTLLTEYDPNLDIDKIKQEEIIRNNREYMKYKGMLKNLDFVQNKKIR